MSKAEINAHNEEAYILGMIRNVQDSDIAYVFGGSKTDHYKFAPEYGAEQYGCYRIYGNWGTVVFRAHENGWSELLKIESIEEGRFKDIKARIEEMNEKGWSD